MDKLLSPVEAPASPETPTAVSRRSFLRYTGAATALTGLLLTSCDDDDDNEEAGTVDVGSGDTGVLNFAYALEQLEAAFYTRVKTGTYYTGLTATSAERQILDDIALHEEAHVDFFRTVLGNSAIKDLDPDFSTINFNDKNSVLTAARTFEDLGVAAYNGAGVFLQSAVNLVVAGKIVSVEARHAALIRDLLTYNSFVASDVVDLFTPTSATSAPGEGSGSGLERSKTPQEVATQANQFLQAGSKLNVSNIR
ncbi:ferritin-like domain-containing protein [Hymenobacter weizhouensis]|uniref:ferritin-like domain-containing protein n=1 Tax=Hymenobacter sp. YIM 151500-1 TaxID=2987689 RepID=UPI0022266413|nr:ferritin-like domain-containing protein [Hymenobacter sp. YIM 151500-1]UYZ61878.1 ferritin-like domain-containing protein [Hymenobacter sp. YIM 151500-1]